MRAHHNRLIILKTPLSDQGGDKLLNTVAMGDKGRQRVVKVRAAGRPQGLVGNAAMHLFLIDDREKPDNPSGWIIRFTRGEFDTHETNFLGEDSVPYCFLQDGVARKDSTGSIGTSGVVTRGRALALFLLSMSRRR